MSREKWPTVVCKFCEKDETTSAPLPTLRPYPDYGKLPNFHYLSWSATPTNGHEPDNFQPRAQIKRLFEESKLVSGDSGAIRKFSDKYIVAEKLVAEYAEHLAQIKMRKEKKKKRRLKGSAMIKAHIGMLLYDSVECQQSRRPLAKKCAVASDFITFRGGN